MEQHEGNSKRHMPGPMPRYWRNLDIGEIGISYAKMAVMTQGNSTISYLAQERQGVAVKRM